MIFVTRSQASKTCAIIALLSLALWLGACDSNSPTAPRQQQPAPVPGTTQPSTVWSLRVTASPNTIGIDGATPIASAITVEARRADNNQPAPNGATVLLSASFGTLTSSSGAVGSTVVVPIFQGQGSAVLAAPGTQAGTIVIQAQLEGSFGQTAISLEAMPEPDTLFIEAVTPNIGHPDGGTRVTVHGTGFDTPVRVFFGGVPGEVESVSGEQIVVYTPPVVLPLGQTRTVSVQVTINVNEIDTQSDTLGNGFTYTRDGKINPDPDPRILSITPRNGPNEGGTLVTIFGEGFSSQVQVLFGTGTALIAAEVRDVSPTRLLVLTPSATGPNSANQDRIVNLTVINLDNGKQAQLAAAFQYGSPSQQVLITSITPTEGLYLGGDRVTIFGQGFDEPVAVGLGTLAQSIISVSGTEIVVRTVPARLNSCQDLSGAASVVNIETGAGDLSGPVFTYRILVPSIRDISPTSSPQGGGGQISISGVRFVAPIRVEFLFSTGAVAADNVFVDSSGTLITANIPGVPSGEVFPQEACDDNGDGTQGQRFLPIRVGIRVFNLDTTCQDTLANAFLFLPNDASCRNDTAPPPPPPPPVALAANFIYSSRQDTATARFTVTFTNTTTPLDYTGVSFEWDFRDGTPLETTVNPAPHVYTMLAESYTSVVKLTATKGSEISIKTDTITVPALPPPPPPPPVTAPVILSCSVVQISGLNVTFTTNFTGAMATPLWDFGDSSGSVQISPTHTYGAAGTYAVSVTVTNSAGNDVCVIAGGVTVP